MPGVSGMRLRGQGETRVNILLDGAYVHGSRRNRMDPATSYAPLTSYDKKTLIRGNQNRSNDFDPAQVQINEPGRSIWLRLSARM